MVRRVYAGNESNTTEKKYSGRKDCPHCEGICTVGVEREVVPVFDFYAWRHTTEAAAPFVGLREGSPQLG